MEKLFFGHQMDRLKRCYSSGALNEDRVKLIWDAFKTIPDARFEKAMDMMIAEHTSQTLPPLSKLKEFVAQARPISGKPGYLEVVYKCEPCEDRGFGFIKNTVVKCVCELGQSLADEEIAVHQANFDKGAKFFRRKVIPTGLFPELPYDPAERIG